MSGDGLDPPEKSQKYRVSEQYWSGSPEIDKLTKPAFNCGSLSARQRKAILMAFCWRSNDGLLIVIFGSSLSSSIKEKQNKKHVKDGPPLTKLSGFAHEKY